jgi:hypothetical protein
MVHLFNKEEVVSPGAFALGETSFLRIGQPGQSKKGNHENGNPQIQDNKG